MLEFKEWLKEQEILEHAKASEGDLEDYRVNNDKVKEYNAIRIKSATVIKNHWDLIGSIYSKNNKKYDVYKIKSGNLYAVVDEILKDNDTERYVFVSEIELSPEPSIGSKLKIDNLFRVAEIITIPGARGDGISTSLYKFFVKTLKMNILGDSEQYFGARKLWSRLSKDNDIVVDIVNISSGKITEKDAIIHHGELDGEFDKRVWTRDDSKWSIRLLLRDIV